jgi:hypothetical protein
MPSHERLAANVARFAGLAAVITIVVGVGVVIGWILDVQTLKSVLPGLVSMKANTALGFVLAGSALWLVRDQRMSHRRRLGATLIAGVILIVAVLTLAEYVFGVDLGIDHLFADPGVSLPGRPSPHTAIAFLMRDLQGDGYGSAFAGDLRGSVPGHPRGPPQAVLHRRPDQRRRRRPHRPPAHPSCAVRAVADRLFCA